MLLDVVGVFCGETPHAQEAALLRLPSDFDIYFGPSL